MRDGYVALAGASAGAGIALVTAADAKLAARISVVAAVVPFADIERLACLATTSRYERNGSVRDYEVTALMRRVVARSLVAALPTGDDRTALLDLLRAQDPDDVDAIRCLSDPGQELGPEARSVVSLLLNDDPERFPNLYGDLPTVIARRLPSCLRASMLLRCALGWKRSHLPTTRTFRSPKPRRSSSSSHKHDSQ